MQFFRAVIFTIIFFLLTATVALAQENKNIVDAVAQKIEWQGIQQSGATLFVHFDKNIYSNNENVWFTGYIIQNNIKGVQHTLSVVLVRNDDRSILTAAKFVIDNGLVFGNMFLPDSLPTGDYSFVCYTNQLINGKPAALFVQPITIKASEVTGFIANLSLTDSIKPGMDSARILLKAYTKDITLVKGAAVKYFIGHRQHPTFSGNLKTDNFGEATIPVPLKAINPANNILRAEINNGTAVKSFTLKLPVYKKDTVIKFYPEGGNLIAGTTNTVGWQCTNIEGEPLAITADLYENDKVIQTVATSAYGMGKFLLLPRPGSRYYVKIKTLQKQYALPVALQHGPAITLISALADDTLLVNINNPATSNNLLLLVHNYRNSFITASVNTNGNPLTVKIPLDEVPKGLATLTLLDSAGRPLSERLFFAHFNKRIKVTITTDSTTYTMRQKVNMRFKMTAADNKPVVGLVSVAVVQNNRFDTKKTKDIESYAYLTREMEALPFKKNILANDPENKILLEQLLLIKGWRRYTWQDLASIEPKDTLFTIDSLTIKGRITLKNKQLKKPVMLNIKKFITTKMTELELIKTDSSGKFELLPANIINASNKKIELSVRKDIPDDYAVTIIDPYKNCSKKLADSLSFDDYTIASFAQSTQAQVLKPGEAAKTLKTVVVSSKKDDSFFSRIPGTNECGDYVCPYGILNCTNHPNEGFQPVVGRNYGNRWSGSIVTQMVYQGCVGLKAIKKDYLMEMEGIYMAKEFYVTDLTKTDKTDPQFLSTLYWNYSIITDKYGVGTATFYTSDIPGKFRIVIQGITDDNMVYGEQYFEVKGDN